MTLIDFQTRDGIATLTLNRPDKTNAISDDLSTQLIDTLDALSRDDWVRALVLTRAGNDIAGMKCAWRSRKASAASTAGSGSGACTLRFRFYTTCPSRRSPR